MALQIFAALLAAAVNLIAVPNVDIAVAQQGRLPQCSGSYWNNCIGRSELSDGDRYVGEFRNHKRNGQGTYTWGNGNRYVGEFVDDKIEGQGTFTFKDGARYVGPFVNEKRHGRGTYTWADRNVYVGDFVADKIEGQGTYSFANGNKYVGAFRNELRNGRGTFTWKDGNMYVGEFVDDKMSGQGVFTFANGEKYVGGFRNEKRNGFGTYTFPNGDRYVGEFVNDDYQGNSVFTFGDGRHFVGEFSGGKKNGRGTFTWQNGEKYVGEFRNDTRNGRGILFAANGTVKQSGNWQADNFKGGPTVALEQVAPPPPPQQRQQAQQQPQPRPDQPSPQDLIAQQQAIIQQLQQQAQQQAQQQQSNLQQQQQNLQVAPNAESGRRVALIIGNTNYKFASALQNPNNDAQLLANTLRSAGFQTVMVKTDLDREGTIRTLREFSNVADAADWAVVYYSGHGIEFGGVNYMVPVDAQLKVDRDIDLETIDVGKVMSAIDGARKLRLVILDACRDNPFAQQMKRTVATRSLGRGLAQIEPTVGTLIVYAAKHGETALDGAGRNSPFIESLVKRINQRPAIEMRRLFDFVRDDVLTTTNRRQQPFSYGSLSATDDFYFTR
ncbi:MAG: caspase family protein [Pseudorhodoplanes sp.]